MKNTNLSSFFLQPHYSVVVREELRLDVSLVCLCYNMRIFS